MGLEVTESENHIGKHIILKGIVKHNDRTMNRVVLLEQKTGQNYDYNAL